MSALPYQSLPYQSVQEVRNHLVAVIMSEDVRTEAGRTLERQLKARVPDVNVMYVDPRLANVMSPDILKAVDQADAVIAAVYVVPTAGKAIAGANGLTNSVALSDSSGVLLTNILDHAASKTVVVAMGSPYLAQDFPAVENYLCAFSNVSISEISAVKALFGEIPIRGHLPVTIPGIAQRGAGIERPRQLAQGGTFHAHSETTSH
jgi:beta-N-acetylhexosaminidase